MHEFGFPALAFPCSEVRVRSEVSGEFSVYDEVRRRWVLLTPEEWVRQHLIHFLVGYRGYPRGLMAVERQVLVNRLPQRADLVVYTPLADPFLLVECKAPSIAVDEGAIRQAARYNNTLRAEYVAITNGLASFVFRFSGEGRVEFVGEEFPVYSCGA